VRGLGVTFLVRRARSSWLLLACVAVTVLLGTGCAAVLWTFADAVIPSGARSILAAPQGRVIGLSGVANSGEAAADSRLIRARLRRAWPGVGFQMNSALWAEPIQLPTPGFIPNTTQVEIAALSGISAQATLTAGQWPGPSRPGGPLPAALPAAVASRLHLASGSLLTGTPTYAHKPISLRITGLYRPRNPASPYWALDLVPVSGISVQRFPVVYAGSAIVGTNVDYGPAVVNPAAFAGGLAASKASWSVLPQARGLSRGNVEGLAAGTSAAVSRLSATLPDGLQITSGLPPLLASVGSTVVLARSLFTIAALELLLVAAAALVLAARLLASMREEESALLRARGATTWQVARPVLAEAVVLGIAAGVAGVLAGTRLTGPLARLGHLSLDSSGPGGGVTSLAWLSALIMLVLCVAVMTWPALHALSPGAARLRRGRQARLAGIAWAGGDLAVVALAAVAVWQLRGYSAVAHPAAGSLGIDPVVAVAPALALAGVALIPLRGLPLLARLADKATDHERRLTSAMVSWQIARRPIRQAGPALLVVVATATTTLALAGNASWRQSAADQAAFSVGSDVRVDAAAQLPEGPAAAIARAPGVTAATSAGLADIGSRGQLIALDARTAGQTIRLRSDLSALPLGTLWHRITPSGLSGLMLPGQPDRLEILGTLGAGPHTSAAEVRRDLGSAAVTAWIQDAAGATYKVAADGLLPVDGRPHALVFTLASSRQAIYPLRLLELTMTYDLPPYDRARPTSAPTARLSIDSLAVAATQAGPFGRLFSRGSGLHPWQPTGSSTFVPAGPPSPFGPPPPADGAPPSVHGWHGVAGGGQRLTFSAGHDPSAKIMHSLDFPHGTPTGQIAIVAPSGQLIPAIATSGYLAASRLHIGSVASVPLGGSGLGGSVAGEPSVSPSGPSVTVEIVASVLRFPTVFGKNRALIADLAEVNDVLAAHQEILLPVTRWWLRTAGDRVPRLPPGLGLSVTGQASQEAALLGNPLMKAPRQAMLAIGLAAVLLGVIGFSISVAASLRSRRTQSAVFAALGVGKAAQAGHLCLEQCALSLPAAAAGLLTGIGLARLMVPAITLTASATTPVPWALVIMPLGPAVALALITAAGPAAAAVLSVLRRPDPAAQLRAEAG